MVIRFETPEYYAALGVWVVRSSARKAMDNLPLNFESREALLSYVQKIVYQKFKYNIDMIFKQSKLLEKIKTQRTLLDF